MSCFPCFSRKKSSDRKNVEPVAARSKEITTPPPPVFENKPTPPAEVKSKTDIFGAEEETSTAKAFNFRELATATKNFRQECLLGEGSFGRVFKATLPASGQIVAVRRLDRGATTGSKEFQVEVLVLSLLSHPNLVKLIGYCADGDQRLLVYEYMPSGSLEKHLFDIPANKKPLQWSERMKIASGIAQGLEYLHEKANPPIIYRDLKSSSIMLDEMNNPRLSGYGLAKLLQSGSSMNVLPRVMAAYGNCAPEYEKNGELTVKSDVYSFGVILLEIITGRRALDTTQPAEEQNLVSWAQPLFSDPNRYPDMADPLMKKQFPVTSLNQAVGVAAMCLQEEPMVRPLIGDIVAALSFLALSPPEAPIPARLVPILSGRVESINHRGNRPSFGDRTMSIRKKEDTSMYKDFEDKKVHPSILKDNEHQDGSENSNSLVKLDKSIDNLKESEKSGSNTKQENNVESQAVSGLLETRSIRLGSIGSQDSSLGFSARFEDSYREQNVPSNPRQVKFQDSFDYDAGLSSDEECSKDTLDSSSQPRPHDRKKSTNSRSNSNKNLQNKDINTNASQGIPVKPSDSDFNPK